MPLMGSLYVGASGLQTSQNALNTTAHNLSNVETKGYVRQQVLLGDRFYNSIGEKSIAKEQIGLGVEYSKVRQVRDEFLDSSYRKENGRSAFYETCYETTNEIETILGELDGASYKESVGKLWQSVEELKKDPTSAVTQGQFVTSAAQFLERAQAVYDGLITYQDNLNSRVKDLVDKINDYGHKIFDYNVAIKKVEMGTEEANDLRDSRNKLLDELSGLVNLSYMEDAEGVVTAQIEGASFIVRDRVFEMGLDEANGTGFYTPTWPWNDNQKVFNLENQIIDSFHDTDIGELKSVLLARGDRRANYTDMDESVYNEGVEDPENPGSKLIATSKSIVMNVEAELDSMVHSIVTEINNILTGEKSKIDAGTDVEYEAAEMDDLIPELFVRLGTERYEEAAGKYKYVQENNADPHHADVSTLYTTSNIKINPDLLKQPTLLSFVTKDKQADQVKADALEAAFSDEFSTLNPNETRKYNYNDFYDALVSQTANAGYVYKSIATNQEATTQSVDNARQHIMGVSSNEELTNMIKFQNAYNASSRYINVVNEMLAHILEKLG